MSEIECIKYIGACAFFGLLSETVAASPRSAQRRWSKQMLSPNEMLYSLFRSVSLDLHVGFLEICFQKQLSEIIFK